MCSLFFSFLLLFQKRLLLIFRQNGPLCAPCNTPCYMGTKNTFTFFFFNLKEHVYLVHTTFAAQLEVSCVIVCGLNIFFSFFSQNLPTPWPSHLQIFLFLLLSLLLFFFFRRTCIRAWSSIFALKNELIYFSTAASRKRLSCDMQNTKTDINFCILM